MNKSKYLYNERFSQLIIPTLILFFVIFLTLSSYNGTAASEDIFFPFKGVSVPYDSVVAVTEEELKMILELEFSYLGVYNDKPMGSTAEMGDYATLQYTASNNVTTRSEGYSIGSMEFGEEFDEQLIGMHCNEEKVFTASVEGSTEVVSYSVKILRLQALADTMTEEIAKTHYGCTASDAIENLIRDTEENRIWEYIYAKILENSAIVIGDKECQDYVQVCMKRHQEEAALQGITLDEYLNGNDLDIETLSQQYTDIYVEMQIFKRLANQEGQYYTSEDVAAYLFELSERYGLPADTILQECGKEYIYYLMYMDYIKTLAVSTAILTDG